MANSLAVLFCSRSNARVILQRAIQDFLTAATTEISTNSSGRARLA